MTLPGQVFRQNALAGSKAMQRAIAQTDLNSARQRNHVLAPWCIMPIDERSLRHSGEYHAGRRLQGRLFGELSLRERHLQFFQMGLLIVTAIESKKSHEI
jgi:hypothetical protein